MRGSSCAWIPDEENNECDQNAVCVNKPGTYDCRCNTGFEGDGFECRNVNECELGLSNCDEFAQCIDNIGSFECQVTLHHCTNNSKNHTLHCNSKILLSA